MTIELSQYFPTTFGVSHFKDEDYRQELIKHCYDLKTKIKSGGEDWLSNETYNTSDGQYNIVNDKKFETLNKWIVKSVEEYLIKTTMNITLNLVDGWLNIYNKNNYQELHRHNTYVMSCIFYLQAPNNFAQTMFYSPYSEMVINEAIYKNQKFDPSGRINFKAKEGDLVMFRSYVQHAVGLHKDNKDRITLAYNFKEAK